MVELEDGWYRVETHFAVAGMKIADNIIVETAPIFNRWRGNRVLDFITFYRLNIHNDFKALPKRST